MIAVIFDMDGVLVDGEPLHFAAAGEILAPLGIELDLETYKGYMGRSGRDIWEDLRGRFGLHLAYDVYQQRYAAAVLEAYRTQTRAPPGARALLDRLHAARIPLRSRLLFTARVGAHRAGRPGLRPLLPRRRRR